MTFPHPRPSDQLVFILRASKDQAALTEPPFHQWMMHQGTAPWCQFFKSDDGYLLRFPELADFTVSLDGCHITTVPVPGVSQPTIEHLYLNQVKPLAFSRQGKLVLHGSAVEIDDFAVSFLGSSGKGKSTLAANFAAHGSRFLTDDCLQLSKVANGYHIHPSHPSIRLWQDSFDAVAPSSAVIALPVDYTPKLRLLADDVFSWCGEERPLQGIYVLGGDDVAETSITPVQGQDAMLALVKNSFLLDIDEREMLKHHFAELADLSRNQLFFRLDFPRSYLGLAEVRNSIINHARRLNTPDAGVKPSAGQ